MAFKPNKYHQEKTERIKKYLREREQTSQEQMRAQLKRMASKGRDKKSE